jgi:hypothetical protein
METVPSYVSFHTVSFLPISLFSSPSKQAGQVIWKEVAGRQDEQFEIADSGMVGLVNVDGRMSPLRASTAPSEAIVEVSDAM